MNQKGSVFQAGYSGSRSLTQDEFVEKANYFIHKSKILPIEKISFQYRTSVCSVFLHTPDEVHKVDIRFFYSNDDNLPSGMKSLTISRNWGSLPKYQPIYETVKAAVGSLKKDLSHHLKMLEKYKAAYDNKLQKVTEVENTLKLYPEYLL